MARPKRFELLTQIRSSTVRQRGRRSKNREFRLRTLTYRCEFHQTFKMLIGPRTPRRNNQPLCRHPAAGFCRL